MTASPTDNLASAERRNQELTKELSRARGELSQARSELVQALEQQAATGGILRAISNSPSNLQGIFQEIVTTAARLCDAYDAGVLQCAGDQLRLVAHRGQIPGQGIVPLSRGVVVGRAVLDRAVLQVTDMLAETEEYPEGSEIARRLGHRTILAVPLIRDRDAIGAIFVRRTEARPFTNRQIELLKTFADQAVIAIENTRLFEAEQASKRELQESLEYQTATSEVLNVISRSPSQLQPVVDAIVQTAKRLCSAERATMWRWREGRFDLLAHTIIDPALAKYLKDNPIPPDRTSLATRAVLEGHTMHVPDLQTEPELGRKDQVVVGRIRTLLAVPLLRKGEPIGVLSLSRSEVKPFSDSEIELVQTFADQAVIAIENTRLFEEVQARTRELTESLEQQTATADVLKVISRSTFDLGPVLETLVENATRLAGAEAGLLARADGEIFRIVAGYGATPEVHEYWRRNVIRLSRGAPVGRAALERRTVHIVDVLADPEYNLWEAQRIHGGRSVLAVPMLRQDDLIGVFFIYRTKVQAFTEKQIELVTTFAEQALIAIENTRLFEEVQARTRELSESLQRQTGTADVLKVISRSAFDLQTVLNTLTESAARLCRANRANIARVRGDSFEFVAFSGFGSEYSEYMKGLQTSKVDRGSITGRTVIEGRTVHVPDVLADPEFTWFEAQKRGGFRTTLGVPLLREGMPIGVFFLTRSTVAPFTQQEIDLVSTFADQAVIAIENVRLFEEVQARNAELRVALEQQTATSELLKVIGRSTFNLHPVFETLAENAVKLCEAEHAFVFRFDGHSLHCVVTHNIPLALKSFVEANPIQPGRGSGAGRAALERRTVQIEDMRTDPEFTYGAAQVGPMRTLLAVPMLRADELLGVIIITRPEVRLFSNNHIALMETFADQAVIAIENTRLFEAEQASKRELQESLEYQTATSDVLGVISRSKFDLQPVLDTIAKIASGLCAAEDVAILLRESGDLRVAAHEGTIMDSQLNVKLPIERGFVGGRTVVDRQPIQVPDLTVAGDEFHRGREIALRLGIRTSLGIPLLREDLAIGCLLLRRKVVRPFDEKQIALLQTFADQAVIAIENTRLFDEVQARTLELAKTVEDLEIASQHKNQFVANMSHELRTPLAAILGYAELIQEGFYEAQGPKSLDALTRIRSNGKHLLGLINTVLDIAKIESGQFTLTMTDYAIESVVETVRAATESLAQNKKLTLTTSVEKSLPVGLGDEQRLTQVLLNLVGNAIKFTDTGEIRVAARVVNGNFAVSVTDTGPGIPEEHQARVFEQFHQVDSSSTRAKGGTGLGLAIAKQIVEMHGGRIWVVSTPGKGSTFQMELPTRAEFRKPGGAA